MKITINHIVILLLIGVIIYLKGCESDKTQEPVTIIKEVIKWDTVRISTIEYEPKWKDRIIEKWDTVYKPIDTLTILQDYYTNYYYEDTVTLDTLGYIVIQDTVTQNEIIYRSIDPILGIPTTVVDRTVYLNQNEFYWGPSIVGRTEGLSFVGVDGIYKNKKRQIFRVGLGVGPELKPSLSLGYYMKIGEKKR